MVACASAIAAAPTRVLPAPQGRTTTPEPPSQNDWAASFWYSRSVQSVSSSAIACASPSTYPAQSSAGQPSLSSACLRLPRSLGWTATESASIRTPSMPATFLLRVTSSKTGRSVVESTSPWTGCLSSRSRP